MTTKLQEYIDAADPQDLKDCLLEHFTKHSKQHWLMIHDLYYDDKAHFEQLSPGCKASILLYLGYQNSRECVVEAFDKMLEEI